MKHDPPIVTIAKVLEPLGPDLYKVALRNGKEVFGHLSRGLRKQHDAPFNLAPGDRVRVEMTPFDFSKARIVSRAGGSDSCDEGSSCGPGDDPLPADSG